MKNKEPILSLAPMAGYTDPAFRLMCLKNGVSAVYSEMISVEALWRKNQRTIDMLKLLPQEKNVILQLFGENPESFKKAVQIINQECFCQINKKQIIGLDINFGCPARKVTKTGAGASLMNDKKKARQIIEAVIQNSKVPVSIKIRSQVKDVDALEFLNYVADLDFKTVMVHGRSLAQGFAGPVDKILLKKIKQEFKNKIVLANGGVQTAEDAVELLQATGADGVGVARGALGNPFIFKQTQDLLRKGKYKEVGFKTIKKTMGQHAEFYLKYGDNLLEMRKHLLHYIKGQKNASVLRQKIIKVENLKDLKQALK